MNVNPLVIECTRSLEMPRFPGKFNDKADNSNVEFFDNIEQGYIVWNYSDERPITYADDVDIEDLTTIQVHLFTNENPQLWKKRLRQAIRSGGFTILSTDEIEETDSDYKYHIAVECNIVGDVSDTEV